MIQTKLSHRSHQEYWKNEKPIRFCDYERNQVIPELFDKNIKILDIGCGNGAVAHYLAQKKDCELVGIDFSLKALEKAAHRGLNLIQADAEHDLPVKDHSFDSVFLGDIIEHVYQPQKLIMESHRVLKSGGGLVVSCPNMGYWRYRLHYFVHGMFPETEWISQKLWQSQHIRFFNRRLLYNLLERHGFKPQKFIGISRRKLDQPLLKDLPQLFGMIMVVKAKKI